MFSPDILEGLYAQPQLKSFLCMRKIFRSIIMVEEGVEDMKVPAEVDLEAGLVVVAVEYKVAALVVVDIVVEVDMQVV